LPKLKISLACVPTDRTRPILDGHIDVPGCAIVPFAGEPDEIFSRALKNGEFDVSELSMSSHIITVAQRDSNYIGIPAFTSRAFRHSSIYIRTDRNIATPHDLKGKRIGLPEYQQTAALWVRGILHEQYGLSPGDLCWRIGGLNSPGHGERIPLQLPPHLDVKPIEHGDTLSAALIRGDIEAIVAPKPPECFVKRTAPVGRLFPEFQTVEAAYAKETNYFPIMHCIAVRRDVAERHPWLPVELFRSFAKAKARALLDLTLTNVSRVSLPWVAQQVEEARSTLGPRFWSYGFAENKRELETMLRYAFNDGSACKELNASELFHPSVLDLPDAL
jgi:4,5-dihydroxyphthalate decarboxylase